MKKENDLFDWKHTRLWRISFIADLLSSLAILVFVLLALAQIYNYNQTAHTQYLKNLAGVLFQDPFFVLNVLLRTGRTLLQGAVYYLVLKGISLGLTMIVETDINYRDKSVEEGVE